ncbi:hypothetical protein Q0F98_29850 [Paenibacillus amylolyticus]|nr:hypothetical protein Q0F98_29850 [Paenibacillus amylolyticus]
MAFWAGLVGAVTGLSNMAMSLILRKLSDRIGPHKVLTFSLIGTGLMLIPGRHLFRPMATHSCSFHDGCVHGWTTSER